MEKLTQKDLIMNYLIEAGRPLAIHEFNIIGVTQNSIGSRLPELAHDGKVVGQKRPGKPYKEWEPAKIKFDASGQRIMF